MKTANIVISCQDRPGIVSAVTTFLFNHQTNIASLEQHIEDGQFFMRVEWQILNSDLVDPPTFLRKFASVQQEFAMDIKVDFNVGPKRIGLFCSRELHCLVDFLGRVEIGEMPVEVTFIISNFPNAESIANKFQIPFHHIPAQGDYENEQLKIVQENKVDLIALARYMKILSKQFVDELGSNRIINVHHSFLPSFVGANPYQEAHTRGVKLIGATAHYVIPQLDQGPIIEQNVKRVNHAYNVADLKILGRELEKEVFAFAIKKHCENKLIIYKNRVIVFA